MKIRLEMVFSLLALLCAAYVLFAAFTSVWQPEKCKARHIPFCGAAAKIVALLFLFSFEKCRERFTAFDALDRVGKHFCDRYDFNFFGKLFGVHDSIGNEELFYW